MDDKLRTNIQNSPHNKIININFEEASLRDFFAGCVLIGMYAESAHPEYTGFKMDDVSQHACQQADAMLAERKNTCHD